MFDLEAPSYLSVWLLVRRIIYEVRSYFIFSFCTGALNKGPLMREHLTLPSIDTCKFTLLSDKRCNDLHSHVTEHCTTLCSSAVRRVCGAFTDCLLKELTCVALDGKYRETVACKRGKNYFWNNSLQYICRIVFTLWSLTSMCIWI